MTCACVLGLALMHPASPWQVIPGRLQAGSQQEHTWHRPEPSEQEEQVQPDSQLEMEPPSRA